MAIRDSKGNPLVIHGPNPIMETQTVWDQRYVVVLNFKPDNCNHAIDDRHPDLELQQEFQIRDIGREMGLEPEEEKAVVINGSDFLDEMAEAPLEPQAETIRVSEKAAAVIQQHQTIFHCVPVEEAAIRDRISGRVRKHRRYGQKYTFDGVLLSENDLQIQFWAIRDVPIQSVVLQQGEARWWRLTGREEKDKGFIYQGVVSEVNPSFT